MPSKKKTLLTIPEAVLESGISRKGIYRTAKRAEDAGHVVRVWDGGRVYVIRSAIHILKRYHYDPKDQSPAAIRRRQEWGVRGGHTPAKRGRPTDAERFAGITEDDLARMRAFLRDIGGDFVKAKALLKLVTRKRGVIPTPPFFVNDTGGIEAEGPPRA